MIGFIFGYMLGSLDQEPYRGGASSLHQILEQINEFNKIIDELIEEHNKKLLEDSNEL